MRILRLTTVFAGIAAVFTAAGVGRVAAYASVDKIGGRRHAMYIAGRTHAVASVGLVLIALIPHGHLPDRGAHWLLIPIVGAAVGALCGATIGAVCGGAAPMQIGDVMGAVIKRPSEALRQLLDPEDLLKLGAAVRNRTLGIFEGIFEPAQKPPAAKPADDAKAKPAEGVEGRIQEPPRADPPQS